jgi:hypothetical protein
MRINALHDLTLIKLIVARFVGTGGFLIRYSNFHTKQAHRQLKKFRYYFNKAILL